MPLNIQPFSFNYQNTLRPIPAPSAPVWGPPDMSKQLQEGIGNLIPNLMKQYDDMNTRRESSLGADELDKAKKALELSGKYTVSPTTGTAPASPQQQGGNIQLKPEIDTLVTAKAKEWNLPESYVRTLIQTESAGDPRATSSTGAKGLTQFTGGTWKQYGVGDPYDPSANLDALGRFTSANRAELTAALGREPTAGELYLAHQQGAAGAVKLLTANRDAPASSVVSERNINVNGGKGLTVGQFTDKWTGRFGGTGPTASPEVVTRGNTAYTVAPGAAAAASSGQQAAADQPSTVVKTRAITPAGTPAAPAIAAGQNRPSTAPAAAAPAPAQALPPPRPVQAADTAIPGADPAATAGVNPQLLRVAALAAQRNPGMFALNPDTAQVRTPEQQQEYVNKGWSKTMNSQHLGGNAIDVVPINPQTGKPDANYTAGYAAINRELNRAAADLGVSGLEWGGNWKSFKDRPHYQLAGSNYDVRQQQTAGGPGTPTAQPGGGPTAPVVPGAPQTVAAAAPGVVTRSPPTQQATASGQNQAPLFQTPQMAAATAGASGVQAPGQPGQEPPPAQQPYAPAQLAAAQSPGIPQPGATMPGTLSDVSPPPPMPGAPVPVQVAQAEPPVEPPATTGSVPAIGVPALAGGATAAPMTLPPEAGGGTPRVPPLPAVAAAEPPPTRQENPAVTTTAPAPAAAAAPAVAAPAVAGVAAATGQPPQVAAGTAATLSRLGISQSAMADISPHMIGALSHAMRSGNPQLLASTVGAVNAITAARQGGGSEGGGWTYQHDTKTGASYRFNTKTGERQVIDPGNTGPGAQPTVDKVLQPGDPERDKYTDPTDPRPWRLTTDDKGNVKPEPVAQNPNQENAMKIANDLESTESYKKFKQSNGAVNAMEGALKEGTAPGDFNATLQAFKVVDPGSTVTTNEQGGIKILGGAEGWGKYFKSKFDANGGVLTEELRAELYNAAKAQTNALWEGGVKDDVEAARRKGLLIGRGDKTIGDMATNFNKEPTPFVRATKETFRNADDPQHQRNRGNRPPPDERQPPKAGEPGSSEDNPIVITSTDQLKGLVRGTWVKIGNKKPEQF